MAGAVAHSGRTVIISDIKDESDAIEQYPAIAPAIAEGIRSFLSVPMIFHDSVIGVLQFRSTEPNVVQSAHVLLAEEVAAQLAGAVANEQYRLNSERRAREETV
jgi:GAF domain-containing protein